MARYLFAMKLDVGELGWSKDNRICETFQKHVPKNRRIVSASKKFNLHVLYPTLKDSNPEDI